MRSDTDANGVNMKQLTDTLASGLRDALAAVPGYFPAATVPAEPRSTAPVIPEGKTLVDSDELMQMKIDKAKAEERERITKEGTGARPGMVEVRANKHTQGNLLLAMTPAPISHS